MKDYINNRASVEHAMQFVLGMQYIEVINYTMSNVLWYTAL